MCIYAVDRNMNYIKIANQDELETYLGKYDVEKEFEDKTIGLMLVYDGFLEMKEVYKDLFYGMHTGNLPHLLVITDADAKKHFDMFGMCAFAKSEFGKLFSIGGEYKPIISNYLRSDGVAL